MCFALLCCALLCCALLCFIASGGDTAWDVESRVELGRDRNGLGEKALPCRREPEVAGEAGQGR